MERFDGEPHTRRARVGFEFGDAVADLRAGGGEVAARRPADQHQAVGLQHVRLLDRKQVVVEPLPPRVGRGLGKHAAATHARDPQPRVPDPERRGGQVDAVEEVPPQPDAAESGVGGERDDAIEAEPP